MTSLTSMLYRGSCRQNHSYSSQPKNPSSGYSGPVAPGRSPPSSPDSWTHQNHPASDEMGLSVNPVQRNGATWATQTRVSDHFKLDQLKWPCRHPQKTTLRALCVWPFQLRCEAKGPRSLLPDLPDLELRLGTLNPCLLISGV